MSGSKYNFKIGEEVVSIIESIPGGAKILSSVFQGKIVETPAGMRKIKGRIIVDTGVPGERLRSVKKYNLFTRSEALKVFKEWLGGENGSK